MDRKHSSAEQLGFYDDSFDSPTSESELIEHTYESGMSPDHQSIRLEGRDLVELYEAWKRVEADLAFIKARLGTRGWVRPKKQNPWLKDWMLRYFFLVSVVLQLLDVLALIASGAYKSPSSRNQTDVYVAVALMSFFQLIHLCVIVISSIKLAKQVLHRTASTMFLAQSYLSTILLFSGIYLLAVVADPDSFGDAVLPKDPTGAVGDVFISALRCLYFSIVTMSTVGFGDIYPVALWAQMIVALQVLVTVVFTTVIFAQGFSKLSGTSMHEVYVPEKNESDAPVQLAPISFNSFAGAGVDTTVSSV
mmetsp:Transcript_43299/g.109371  ORF Transcript_43299/g.109371 Transcript_43299/m.109371 type:complete len:306 (-) Transcript_43299:140-1057(-)|eukprot:CAMPEP_0177645036 /NCGR_PEP_ID=MMETSP0447-20121125/9029_1 /TAXON_ID=0 /ORGANISM="Stygamoeba regulata, Strain BSH-02190019" /LENGTH=305 /DNA_ID=CAMNT_0019147481 /DNA_START=387 /DNA_END=1304 /DNA_ORIENTATION=-